jgi:hypothetical protein
MLVVGIVPDGARLATRPNASLPKKWSANMIAA